MGRMANRADLGMTRSDRHVALVAFPVIGALAGLALPFVWRWVDDVEWLPFRGPLQTLMSLDEGWHSVLRIVILAVAGLALAVWAILDDTAVSVGADDVVVRRQGGSRTIPREQIAGVYLDGKNLVIETAQGRRLLDRPVDGARKRGAEAFTTFGYPWESDR